MNKKRLEITQEGINNSITNPLGPWKAKIIIAKQMQDKKSAEASKNLLKKSKDHSKI